MPGLQQRLQVAHIELSPQTKKELDERFVLIYTGQRRLARNLLRDVVGRYVGNEPDSLFALEEIQKTAALMRFELERGNVDGFAKLLDYHWELSKKIDAGSSNTLIEQIFSSIEELVDGKLVCGAGGGGFLQVSTPLCDRGTHSLFTLVSFEDDGRIVVIGFAILALNSFRVATVGFS